MLLKYDIKVYKYAIKVYKYTLNERRFVQKIKEKLVYTHRWILLIISSILAVITFIFKIKWVLSKLISIITR